MQSTVPGMNILTPCQEHAWVMGYMHVHQYLLELCLSKLSTLID